MVLSSKPAKPSPYTKSSDDPLLYDVLLRCPIDDSGKMTRWHRLPDEPGLNMLSKIAAELRATNGNEAGKRYSTGVEYMVVARS